LFFGHVCCGGWYWGGKKGLNGLLYSEGYRENIDKSQARNKRDGEGKKAVFKKLGSESNGRTKVWDRHGVPSFQAALELILELDWARRSKLPSFQGSEQGA
jgi:hypothetical protein